MSDVKRYTYSPRLAKFICAEPMWFGVNTDFVTASDYDALAARLAEALRLLRRYRTETPLGHQPHMIAHEADAVLRTADSAPAQENEAHG